jgi:hypothetical protein
MTSKHVRAFPFLAAALTAFAVTACATAPTPSPDTLSGSIIDNGTASSSQENWTAPPETPYVDAPDDAGMGTSSESPDFTTYVSPQGFYLSLPVSAWIGANETAVVTAFEDPAKDRVFIAAAAYDDPTTPAVDRIPTTVDVLRGPNRSWVPHWTMDVTDIADDAALDTWVKEHYGPGCSIAERSTTAQPGVQDVLLATDGLPLDTTRCVLNFAYEIRYQPSKARVLSWELGQGPQFAAGSGTDEIYDLAMRDSVRMSD